MLSGRERKKMREIEKWFDHVSVDNIHGEMKIVRDLEKWIGKHTFQYQNIVHSQLEEILQLTNQTICNSKMQRDAQNRIVSSGKSINECIEKVEDMQFLSMEELMGICEDELAKHRLLILSQGLITGGKQKIGFVGDIPLLTIIVMKAMQCIATTYGYNVWRPFEMEVLMRVFYASLYFNHDGVRLSKTLMNDCLHQKEYAFFFDKKDDVVHKKIPTLSVQLLGKSMFVYYVNGKTKSKFSIIGRGVNSIVNYRIAKKMTTFAHHFYLLRFLKEKE